MQISVLKKKTAAAAAAIAALPAATEAGTSLQATSVSGNVYNQSNEPVAADPARSHSSLQAVASATGYVTTGYSYDSSGRVTGTYPIGHETSASSSFTATVIGAGRPVIGAYGSTYYGPSGYSASVAGRTAAYVVAGTSIYTAAPGDTVSGNCGATGTTFDWSAYTAGSTIVVGIADAPAPYASYQPYLTSFSTPVDPTVPVPVTFGFSSFEAHRDTVAFPTIVGDFPSPFRDTLEATCKLFLEGTLVGQMTRTINYDPGESQLKSLDVATGQTTALVDFSSLSGDPSALLSLQYTISATAYDASGQAQSPTVLYADTVSQNVTVPEPASLGALTMIAASSLLRRRGNPRRAAYG